MPKWKGKKAGDELRVSKGKYAFEINFEIREECESENDDDIDDLTGGRVKTAVKPIPVAEPIDNRNYSEILLEAFEKANDKFSQMRLNALTTICNQLQRHYIPKFVNKHLPTMRNIIEEVFERNIGSEVNCIARLITLCYLQLPREIKFLDRFRPMVIDAFDNPILNGRTDLCNVIAVLVFLNKKSSKLVFNTMAKFEEIFFKNSYANLHCYNIATKKAPTIEELDLLVSSLEAWTFLYTLVVGDIKPENMRGDVFIQNLVALLKCSFYNLRIAGAKTIAVIYGSGGKTTEKAYVEDNLTKIVADITMIRKDYLYHDDKIKSAVLFYFKMGTIPRREIRIGKRILHLDTWSYNIQYDVLCSIFGSANVPKLLQDNKFLVNLLETYNKFESQSIKESSISTECGESIE